MSEQIREQVSAFIDGELPGSETELLLKRLLRDADLRESFGRYALVGECLRGGGRTRLSPGFSSRVNTAIDGEPAFAGTLGGAPRTAAWWRPLAGAAVAAGVAAVAVVALQQRAVAPPLRAAQPVAALSARSVRNIDLRATPGTAGQLASAASANEPQSYTVPPAVADGSSPLSAARYTSYVFAHSQYSSVLGRSTVLSDLLADGDDAAAAEVGGAARALGGFGADRPPDIRVAP